MTLLGDLAHGRAGDKGDVSDLSVIAYRAEDYSRVLATVTEENVLRHLAFLGVTEVHRFELPQLHAVKLVLSGALGGGVTRSVRLDAHGKTVSSVLLAMEVAG